MALLILDIPDDYPCILDLEVEKTIRIGRSKNNTLVINDPSVSAFHAELTREDPNCIRLKDLESYNGTEVNAQRIREMLLKDGDKVKFGSVKALFKAFSEGPEPAQDAYGIKVLQMEAEALLRKSEIERNNLKLLKADGRMVRSVLEESLQIKTELEEQLAGLRKELNSAWTELEVRRKESKELAPLIAEAKAYQKQSAEWDTLLKKRETTCEELSRKIIAGEKLLQDLDLANSIRKKEELKRDLERLSEEITSSRSERDIIKRTAEEASVVFEKAKAIEARIGGLEDELKKQEHLREELDQKIAEREGDLADLDAKIAARQSELESLNRLIEEKEQEVQKLAEIATRNEERARAAQVSQTAMEAAVSKGQTELALASETRQSLEKKSLILTRIIGEKSLVLQRLKAKIQTRGTRESPCPPLRLIDPQLTTLVHYFHHGAGIPDEGRIAPVGYYSLAACTRGSLHRDASSILSSDDPVLLLLSGEAGSDRDRIRSLAAQGPGRFLLVCWPEGKLKALSDATPHLALSDLLNGVAGILAADPNTARLLKEMKTTLPILNLPLSCPIDYPAWNVSLPLSNRKRGIFVSGDGFDPDSPHHRTRLDLINRLTAQTQTTVSLYHHQPDPIEGLNIPGDRLALPAAPQKYSDYLRLIGEHHLVTSFGKNFLGGEVSGDAALARTLFCWGAPDNTVDQLIFPDGTINGDDLEGTLENAKRLLTDADAYQEALERSQDMADQLISFENVRDRIGEFIAQLAAK